MSSDFPSRRPMEAFDALMYRAESDPRGRSTLLGVFILDRTPDWERLVEAYERITRLIVVLRQRVVEPLVPVTNPVWAVDPTFDLSYHLRRAHVPSPGTQAELLAFLEPVMMAPLDLARPLWEFTLVEGLEGGRAAWVTKTNHAIADGMGGQELARWSFDLERDPPPVEMPPAPVPDPLSPNGVMLHALVDAPRSVLHAAAQGAQGAARWAEGLIRRPGRTVADSAGYARSLGRLFNGPGVANSPLLTKRGLRRRLLVLEVPLDDLKAASKTAGGSLNDGFLAAVCGGLRRYHEALGSPIESLPVAIPISLRREGDPAGGNRWAGAQLAPPVGEPDPAVRIRVIHQLMLDARQEPALSAMDLFAPVVVHIPPPLLAAAFGGASFPDVQVSNVPGSPVPLYMVGAKVEKLFPFGPVPGPATMITVHSYLRTCFVGVNLDPDAITEPDRFLDCLQQGIDEVLALQPTPTPTPKAKPSSKSTAKAKAKANPNPTPKARAGAKKSGGGSSSTVR